MNFILKFEKTIFFFLKIIIICLILTIFFVSLSIQIPQLKTINRTSIISLSIFLITIFNLIQIFGDFKIGQTQISEIKNALTLATIVTDLITFTVTFFMGLSSMQYLEFYNKIHQNTSTAQTLNKNIYPAFIKYYLYNKILPSTFILIFIILVQLIVLHFSIKFISKMYFKIHPPKNTTIIFNNKYDLFFLVSKIKKSASIWNLTTFVKFDDPDIFKIIKQNDAIFFTDIPKQYRINLIKFCYKLNKPTFIYPDIADVLLHNSNKFMVDDSLVYEFNNLNISFEQAVFKRIFDIIFSLIFLFLFSPIMLTTAAIIKLYDKGPIFFKQNRLTKNAHEFQLLKFRSMQLNAEKNTGAILAKENDVRITPIGKFLRRFRIDELPQLINILKGELSLVGPRPERKEYAQKFEKKLPEFKYRLKVKAGLTGLAQISGKYNTSPKDKLTLDLFYIQKYSLWLDIKIILKTLIIFLKSDSTEGEKKINKSIIEFTQNKIKK